MDLALWKRVSIRAFEADYVPAHQNFADFAPAGLYVRRQVFPDSAYGGVVFNFGSLGAGTACGRRLSVQPSEVMVGEPITARLPAATSIQAHANYEWNATGGKINAKIARPALTRTV